MEFDSNLDKILCYLYQQYPVSWTPRQAQKVVVNWWWSFYLSLHLCSWGSHHSIYKSLWSNCLLYWYWPIYIWSRVNSRSFTTSLSIVAALRYDDSIHQTCSSAGSRVKVVWGSTDLEWVWVVALCPGNAAVSLLLSDAGLVVLVAQVLVGGGQEVEGADLAWGPRVILKTASRGQQSRGAGDITHLDKESKY